MRLSWNLGEKLSEGNVLTFTFTFTFGEDSMLSSAEAVVSYGSMRSPEITKRLYKSLWGFCKPQKSVVELVVIL